MTPTFEAELAMWDDPAARHFIEVHQPSPLAPPEHSEVFPQSPTSMRT
jgi:hypothetical protein